MNDITSRLSAEYEQDLQRRLSEQWVTEAMQTLNDTIKQQQATIAALEAEVQRLRAALDTETDAALETWGVLTGIRAWLRGDLPEADVTQFIALIDGMDADARRALESDTP